MRKIYNSNIKSAKPTFRQKAEALMKEKRSFQGLSRNNDETLEHVYELEVHQIELELQIEALILERSVAEKTSKKYKDASDKYIELYEIAPSGYFTLSNKGEIIELNINGAKKLGKKRSLLKNSLFGFFVSEDTRPIFNLFLGNVFNSNVKKTCRVTLLGENNIPVYVYIAGIASENKEQCYVSIIDITELNQEEQQLIIAKESSEENGRFKSSLLADMNHEIKNPLKGILSFTELLKRPGISDELHLICINMIEQGSTHILNIIDDLLDTSKIESGHINVHISSCNINEQIEYIYTFFKPEVEGKGMQLVFKNSLPSKVAVIQTDIEKILAILTNLVKNATKYSEKGTIEFGYSLKPAGVFLEVEFFVRDTGLGIPQDKMKTIFERYIQVAKNTNSATQGVGLGLAISKSYVEMLGGEIWVESEIGKGSTFYFTIPYNYKSSGKEIIKNVLPDEEKEK